MKKLLALMVAMIVICWATNLEAVEWKTANTYCYAWTTCPSGQIIRCHVWGPCRWRLVPNSYVECQGYTDFGYWATITQSCFVLWEDEDEIK